MHSLRRAQISCILLTIWLTAILAGGCIAPARTPQASVPAMLPGPSAREQLVGTQIAASATRTSTPILITATGSSTSTDAPTRPSTPTPTASATPPPSPTETATPTPGPTPDGVARTLEVPILMYHYVSEPPADADIYRRDLSVTPERFAEHLRYLKEAGYTSITLDDLLYALTTGRSLPDKPIILTFDDGYADNYENAFRLLNSYGFIGHFFIITDFVNQGRDGYLSWPQIEEMAAAGHRFGSHSRDHPNLSDQSVDYLVWQSLGSKEAIEEHLGYHPRWIAYPSGEYDDQTIAVYHSAGYWGGLTIQQGIKNSSDNIFELRRVRVRGVHTADDLAALLSLDW